MSNHMEEEGGTISDRELAWTADCRREHVAPWQSWFSDFGAAWLIPAPWQPPGEVTAVWSWLAQTNAQAGADQTPRNAAPSASMEATRCLRNRLIRNKLIRLSEWARPNRRGNLIIWRLVGTHDPHDWMSADVREREIDHMGSWVDRDGVGMSHDHVAVVHELATPFRQDRHDA